MFKMRMGARVSRRLTGDGSGVKRVKGEFGRRSVKSEGEGRCER